MDSSYYKAAASVLDVKSKISTIETWKLAEAIMRAEGTYNSYIKWWKDLNSYWQQNPSEWKWFIDRFIPTYKAYNEKLTLPDSKELYRMYWILDPKKATDVFVSEALSYKNNVPVYSDNKDEIYKSLSPQAKAVVDGNSLLSSTSMDAKTRSAITSELWSKWWYDLWLWNDNYFSLKNDDRNWIVALLNMQDMINTMVTLDPNINTNRIKSIVNWLATTFSWLWIAQPSEDYLSLKMASWKALVKYIKEISWTAVSDKERENLEKYMPNVSMSDKEFKVSLWKLVSEYNNILNSKLQQYNFDDIWTLKTALLWANKPQFSYWTVWVWNIYDFATWISWVTWSNSMINKEY